MRLVLISCLPLLTGMKHRERAKDYEIRYTITYRFEQERIEICYPNLTAEQAKW